MSMTSFLARLYRAGSNGPQVANWSGKHLLNPDLRRRALAKYFFGSKQSRCTSTHLGRRFESELRFYARQLFPPEEAKRLQDLIADRVYGA